MKKMRSWSEGGCGVVAVVAALLAGVGCADDVKAPQPEARGNAALGIARFEITEGPELTTVVGLDADGAEVGRLELVHGTYTMSSVFSEQYDGPQPVVEGRRMTVNVGSQEMKYESRSFEPVMQLPAHPMSHLAIARFVEDPHVKGVLTKWKLGFEAGAGGDWMNEADPEAAYAFTARFYEAVTDIIDCSYASSCTLHQGQVAQNCNGTAHEVFAGYRAANTETVIVQCCPTGNIVAKKMCDDINGGTTTCGTPSSGPCIVCQTYSVNNTKCEVQPNWTSSYLCGYEKDSSSSICASGQYWDIGSCTCMSVECGTSGYGACSAGICTFVPGFPTGYWECQ